MVANGLAVVVPGLVLSGDWCPPAAAGLLLALVAGLATFAAFDLSSC